MNLHLILEASSMALVWSLCQPRGWKPCRRQAVIKAGFWSRGIPPPPLTLPSSLSPVPFPEFTKQTTKAVGQDWCCCWATRSHMLSICTPAQAGPCLPCMRSMDLEPLSHPRDIQGTWHPATHKAGKRLHTLSHCLLPYSQDTGSKRLSES